MKGISSLSLLCALVMLCLPAQAKHSSEHPLSDEDWQVVLEKVELLETSGLVPTLLPVVLRNRDTLQLTDEQVKSFRAWRKQNYTNMVNVMNDIIEKMFRFRIESLSPDISEEHLVAFQAEIHDLQRQLLKIKLSCRKLLMTSFTDEQWENFAFVVSDNARLSSLVGQLSTVVVTHKH